MKKILLFIILVLSYTNASILVLKTLEPNIKKQGNYFLLDKSSIDNKEDINNCIIYDNNKTANIICSVKKEIFAEVAIVPITHSKNGHLIFLENFIQLTPLQLKK